MGHSSQALRSPGYPVFLAGCRWLFGDRSLPVRLVQALIASLAMTTRQIDSQAAASDLDDRKPKTGCQGRRAIAGLLYACDPGQVGMSILLLSEAIYTPLLLLAGLGLCQIAARDDGLVEPVTSWPKASYAGIAVAVGACLGGSTLVRPSGALLALFWIGAMPLTAGRGRRTRLLGLAAAMLLGLALVMAPWWWRNARAPWSLRSHGNLGRGKSLRRAQSSRRRVEQHGLSERTGNLVTRRAGPGSGAYAESHKFCLEESAGFSPWESRKARWYRSPMPLADIGAPVFVCAVLPIPAVVIYLAARRFVGSPARSARSRDLGGARTRLPLLHMVFVGSPRYRIAAFPPAYALAAIGLVCASAIFRRGYTRRLPVMVSERARAPRMEEPGDADCTTSSQAMADSAGRGPLRLRVLVRLRLLAR